MFRWYKAIKAFLTAKKEMGKIMEKKQGWKTTEFWINAIIIAITLFAGVISFIPAALSAKIIAGLAAVYTIARTIVKLTPSSKDDEEIARIGAVLAEKLGIKPEQPK